MRLSLKLISELIDFKSKYEIICKGHLQLENGKTFRKNEVSQIIIDLGLEMKFDAPSEIFYKDYEFADFNLRLIIPYKYGYVDCMYAAWNSE